MFSIFDKWRPFCNRFNNCDNRAIEMVDECWSWWGMSNWYFIRRIPHTNSIAPVNMYQVLLSKIQFILGVV